MADDDAPKKKRGRPRRNGTKSTNQRAEIAAAALELFSRQGYAQTTLSEIARAAGLDQSSVYYWFSGKDDILRHLAELNRSSLLVATGIGSFPHDKPAQLYTVLHADALMLCRLPFDFYVLEEAARAQPDNFAEFFADYRALLARVRDLIAEGVAEGSLRPCDAQREAALALAMNEGAQHRLHWPSVAGANAAFLAGDVADAAASATVARLLADGDIAAVRACARERKWVES